MNVGDIYYTIIDPGKIVKVVIVIVEQRARTKSNPMFSDVLKNTIPIESITLIRAVLENQSGLYYVTENEVIGVGKKSYKLYKNKSELEDVLKDYGEWKKINTKQPSKMGINLEKVTDLYTVYNNKICRVRIALNAVGKHYKGYKPQADQNNYYTVFPAGLLCIPELEIEESYYCFIEGCHTMFMLDLERKEIIIKIDGQGRPVVIPFFDSKEQCLADFASRK